MLRRPPIIENVRNRMAQFSGLFFSAAIAFFVWFAGYLGLLGIFDVIAYDLFVKTTPATDRSAISVLLIESPEEKRHDRDGTWHDLVKTLKDLGAERIVFSFLPDGEPARFWEEIKVSGKIFVSRELVEDPDRPGRILLRTIPAEMTALNIDYGVSAPPLVEHGVYRRQVTGVTIEGSAYDTLEVKAAEGRIKKKNVTEEDTYLVNFSGGQELPRVSLERVTAKGLVPEIVKGKTVLIGLRSPVRDAGFYTPLGKNLSLLEYQGYALDTILRGRIVRETGPVLALFFTLLIACVIVVGANIFDIRCTIWCSVVVLGINAVLSWIALSYFSIWVPFARILVTQIVVTAILTRRKSAIAERAADSILLDISTKLRERLMPESFYDSEQYWSQVITMLDQILNLSRTILLEKIEENHRVREVKALRCSIDDIQERRRDYKRAPYSIAISEGGPIKLDRAFLKETSAREDQYLSPLIFGGHTIGFWVFGIDPLNAASIPMFHVAVRDFSKQMSELLYRRQSWRRRKEEQEKALQSFISLRFQDISQREVRSSIDLLERRLVLLEKLFSGLDTAVLLYDVFGRVLQANEKMLDLAKTRQLSLYEMTALDFAVVLSGLKPEEMRFRLYRIILEHAEVTLDVKDLEKDGVRRILRMRAIIGDIDSAEFPGMSVLGVYGILFEIQEYPAEKMHSETQGRRDAEKAASSSSVVNPADLIIIISRSMAEGLLRRGITIAHRFPDDTYLVEIGKRVLRDSIEAVISVLAHDAIEGSTLSVSLVPAEGRVMLVFSNEGFGIPDDTLQRYLFSDNAAVSGDFMRLRKAVEELRRWQGEVEAESEIGVGTRFTLRLKMTD